MFSSTQSNTNPAYENPCLSLVTDDSPLSNGRHVHLLDQMVRQMMYTASTPNIARSSIRGYQF